jgi:HlyD family secretion protein
MALMSNGDLESVPDDGSWPEAEDEDRAGRTWVLPGRGWRVGGRLPGSPERRSRALPVLVVLALLLGIVAGMIARGFISPAQVAANAKGPKASLITQRVRFGVLAVPVNMRASISNGNPLQIGAPSDLGGSLAVVTSVNVAPGQRVGQGQLLLTVAERPVFVFAGTIPVFRAMTPGIRGSDVTQLQAGLQAAGFGIGSDASATYGPGTAAAVSALYKAHGIRPMLSGSRSQLKQLAGQVAAAQKALSKAKAKLAADEQSHAKPPVLRADRAAVAAAERQLSAAEHALANERKVTGAQIPMGEVVFVPHLPARVLTVAKLGSTVGSSSSSNSGNPRGPGNSSSAAVQLGSGKVTLSGYASPIDTRLLRPGMTGTAISDLSGSRFAVRVSSVRGPRVLFVPVGKVPSNVIGQNVQVSITASRVRSLIVPVAAVSTAASGQPYVTVDRGGGHTAAVPVRLGISSGGLQAVTPVHSGALRPGNLVVLGIGSRASPRPRGKPVKLGAP